MVIDLHAKNQVNICKRSGKMSGKLILQTDKTDRKTKCKNKVPFGFASSGLKRGHNCARNTLMSLLEMFPFDYEKLEEF